MHKLSALEIKHWISYESTYCLAWNAINEIVSSRWKQWAKLKIYSIHRFVYWSFSILHFFSFQFTEYKMIELSYKFFVFLSKQTKIHYLLSAILNLYFLCPVSEWQSSDFHRITNTCATWQTVLTTAISKYRINRKKN